MTQSVFTRPLGTETYEKETNADLLSSTRLNPWRILLLKVIRKLQSEAPRLHNVSAYVALIQYVDMKKGSTRAVLQVLDVYAGHLNLRPHRHIRRYMDTLLRSPSCGANPRNNVTDEL